MAERLESKPAPLVLVHGTWGRNDSWFRPGSPFVEGVRREGLELVHPTEPFFWSGRIGGFKSWVVPDDPEDALDDHGLLEWANEARHLTYYCAAMRPGEPVSVLAHSHGGQLAQIAIVAGALKVHHLITVSTPPRKDLREISRLVPALIRGQWVHLYGEFWKDWMIKLGQFLDGHLGWVRTFPEASKNVLVRGAGHSDILDVGVLASYGVLQVLRS